MHTVVRRPARATLVHTKAIFRVRTVTGRPRAGRGFHSSRVSRAEKDYYKILEIDRKATKDEVKKAYRRLAKKYHPDLNKSPGAGARFAEIQEAHEVLSDDSKRASYDQFGSSGNPFGEGGFQGFTGGGPGGRQGFEDIFSEFEREFGRFGRPGGQGQDRSSPVRGSDITQPLSISFVDAALGTSADVTVQGEGKCDTCSGTGARAGTTASTCGTCGGLGKVTMSVGGFMAVERPCSQCGGTGKLMQACGSCGGSGTSRARRSVTVKVPAGVSDGLRLRLRGQGNQGPASGGRAGVPGDLFVQVDIQPDPYFRREGNDIHVDLPITLSEALLGAVKPLPTLKGEVELRVAPGTQPGGRLKLKGRGIRPAKGAVGDQIVHCNVALPRTLSPAAKALAEQLAEEEAEEAAKSASGGFISDTITRIRNLLKRRGDES